MPANHRLAVPFLFLLPLLVFLIDSSQGILTAPGGETAGGRPGVVLAAERTFAAGETIANCRYGVVSGVDQEVHVPRIGAGWFMDFNPPQPPVPVTTNDAEFAHLFMVFQRKTADGAYLPAYRTVVPLNNQFAALIEDNPGDMWFIGNEVDRGPNPDFLWSGQGDMFPEIYARAYHDVRAFIKSHDATARVAPSALVQVTPGRLQYLDKVWAAYQKLYGGPMPVDVWNMHLYILPEVEPDGVTPNGIASVANGTDPTLGKRSSGNDPNRCADDDVYCFAEHDNMDIFAEQVIAMRQWMKEHGQQQKPLILSEFSLLYPYIDEGESCFLQDEYGGCFTPDRVSSFMVKAFNYLNTLKRQDLGYALDSNRLVQQWNWFSIYTNQAGDVSNIVRADQETLTQVGNTYRQSVFAEPPTVNLLIDDIPRVVTAVDPATGKATAKLRVKIRNNGNTAVDQPFKVTYYLDPGRGKPLGSVTISEPVRGCATSVYTAELPWPNLTPGAYFYWVKVDSEDVIAETPSAPADNLGFGLVRVFATNTYVPALRN